VEFSSVLVPASARYVRTVSLCEGGVPRRVDPVPSTTVTAPSSAAALVALAVGGDPAVVVSFPPAGPSRLSIRVSS